MKIYLYLFFMFISAMPFFVAWFNEIAERFRQPKRRMSHYAEISREYTRQGLVPIPVRSRRNH